MQECAHLLAVCGEFVILHCSRFQLGTGKTIPPLGGLAALMRLQSAASLQPELEWHTTWLAGEPGGKTGIPYAAYSALPTCRIPNSRYVPLPLASPSRMNHVESPSRQRITPQICQRASAISTTYTAYNIISTWQSPKMDRALV